MPSRDGGYVATKLRSGGVAERPQKGGEGEDEDPTYYSDGHEPFADS